MVYLPSPASSVAEALTGTAVAVLPNSSAKTHTFIDALSPAVMNPTNIDAQVSVLRHAESGIDVVHVAHTHRPEESVLFRRHVVHDSGTAQAQALLSPGTRIVLHQPQIVGKSPDEVGFYLAYSSAQVLLGKSHSDPSDPILVGPFFPLPAAQARDVLDRLRVKDYKSQAKDHEVHNRIMELFAAGDSESFVLALKALNRWQSPSMASVFELLLENNRRKDLVSKANQGREGLFWLWRAATNYLANLPQGQAPLARFEALFEELLGRSWNRDKVMLFPDQFDWRAILKHDGIKQEVFDSVLKVATTPILNSNIDHNLLSPESNAALGSLQKGLLCFSEADKNLIVKSLANHLISPKGYGAIRSEDLYPSVAELLKHIGTNEAAEQMVAIAKILYSRKKVGSGSDHLIAEHQIHKCLSETAQPAALEFLIQQISQAPSYSQKREILKWLGDQGMQALLREDLNKAEQGQNYWEQLKTALFKPVSWFYVVAGVFSGVSKATLKSDLELLEAELKSGSKKPVRKVS
ncbi:MAG: hypothetical protein H7A33_02355 [Deltaproteobacteria bacterium]|nr:hypothetical protein [Deltaproteobacteria bacterium]